MCILCILRQSLQDDAAAEHRRRQPEAGVQETDAEQADPNVYLHVHGERGVGKSHMINLLQVLLSQAGYITDIAQDVGHEVLVIEDPRSVPFGTTGPALSPAAQQDQDFDSVQLSQERANVELTRATAVEKLALSVRTLYDANEQQAALAVGHELQKLLTKQL